MASRRATRLNQIRYGLKLLLGGRCCRCGDRRLYRLEIDHAQGCTWVQRSYNTETRWYRYLREYRSGVKLTLKCRSCNARENQWTHGTRAERALRLVSNS